MIPYKCPEPKPIAIAILGLFGGIGYPLARIVVQLGLDPDLYSRMLPIEYISNALTGTALGVACGVAITVSRWLWVQIGFAVALGFLAYGVGSEALLAFLGKWTFDDLGRFVLYDWPVRVMWGSGVTASITCSNQFLIRSGKCWAALPLYAMLAGIFASIDLRGLGVSLRRGGLTGDFPIVAVRIDAWEMAAGAVFGLAQFLGMLTILTFAPKWNRLQGRNLGCAKPSDANPKDR